MELLLILSALFSALTGALNVRAPATPAHQTAIAPMSVSAARAQRATLRPVALPPTLAAIAEPISTVAVQGFVAIPLYAARRRE